VYINTLPVKISTLRWFYDTINCSLEQKKILQMQKFILMESYLLKHV